MATGNGAYIVHKELGKNISGYSIKGYSPYLTLFPFLLKAAVNTKNAELIHTTPDYAFFSMQQSIPSIITFPPTFFNINFKSDFFSPYYNIENNLLII